MAVLAYFNHHYFAAVMEVGYFAFSCSPYFMADSAYSVVNSAFQVASSAYQVASSASSDLAVNQAA